MTKKTEKEFKLVSTANTQFKFALIGPVDKVIAVVRHFCDWLNITCGKIETIDITDTYYDDERYTIKEKKCSLRLREIKGQPQLVTFKKDKKLYVPPIAAVRDEIEYKIKKGEMGDTISQGLINKLERAIGEDWQFGNDGKNLVPVFKVINKRIQFPIETEQGNYTFCFDRYYYQDKNDNYSEYYSEIEIEAKDDMKKQDASLSKLGDALCNILDYEQSQESKYKRGVAWLLNRQNDYIIVHTLMIDVVKYSQRTADIQKQIVQTLNHYAKDVLKKIRPNDYKKIVTIPTGDGLLFIFENEPEKLITLVFELQAMVRKKYNISNHTNQFEFRAGLHTGPVFKYTDINEGLNYAGSGINIAQRAMSFGDKWHILATTEAQHSIVQKNSQLKDLFNKMSKKYKTKHDEELIIYNVYDNDHGNKSNP